MAIRETMIFQQLHSSSKGNLYIVTATNGKRLMLECGVKWKRLQNALKYNLKGIEACFVTHEHADHSVAAKDVLKAGVEVCASRGTLEALGIELGRRVNTVADKTLLRYPTFEVFCFDVNHDAKEPLGYIVREKETNEYLLFVTDSSHIVQRFPYQFSIIAIECSYDKAILQDRVDRQDINESLAKRLLASHMEKETAKRYIQYFCDLSKCREVHLLHMSGDNLDKGKTRQEFESEFFIKTIIMGRHGCLFTSEK